MIKINAASRLKATSDESIEDIKRKLAIDGYVIQRNNQSITFQYYVHPSSSYLKALDKTYGPHKTGSNRDGPIYIWNLRTIGVKLYWPTDPSKAVKIQLYNRDERYATVVKGYDNTWIKRMDQHRQAHPKYQGQQKPSQLTDEHIFTLAPSALAQRLQEVYKDDYKGAAGALTMYKNRMGKNLKTPDQARIDQAKDELKKRYGKDDESKDQNKGKPSSGKPTKSGSKSAPIGSRPTGKVV